MSNIASLWRHDGMIEYILPPHVAVNTFISIAAQHSSWLCFLTEDFASVLSNGDVEGGMAQKYHVDIDTLSKGLRKSHDTAEQGSRIRRGTTAYLDGMLYGTMHPAELAALADDLTTIAIAYAITGQTDSGKSLTQSWKFWMDGAKEFVEPQEHWSALLAGSEHA